jgi:GNAT superfamily N-acetyltransferase
VIEVEAATIADCRALASTSKKSFDHDVRHGAPGPGGPPGYDSVAWHRRALGWGRVFRLVRDARIVGGAIVIVHRGGHMELARIWLEPTFQGRRLGAAVVGIIEARFADARRWTLETPCWNLRNQAFYAKLGYREIRRTESQVCYEKRCGATEPAGQRPGEPPRRP